MAVVDGEPVTREDLKYSLQISHRRDDLSYAGALNISEYVQKLIDDRLIIQEAHRMGMEDYPEVQKAVSAYILRESVIRLHDEEIVKKVSVTEEDIINYYKKNYERFSLGVIEVNSEETAKEILEQLKNGGDFGELARQYSIHPSKEKGGEINLTRGSMWNFLEEIVFNLKHGEFSDIIKADNKYYIVKLLSRQEAPDKELENFREGIKKAVRSQRQKELEDEYLRHLREGASIKVNQEILSAIKLDGEERKKWSEDERVLAEVSGSVLKVKDFVTMLPPIFKKSKEEALNNWIDRKLIDQEALSRHYEMKPDLRDMVSHYKYQLLKKTFIERVIIPRIEISDKALEEYYLSHQKEFLKPVSYRVQQITLKTMEDAQDVLSNLQKGADFSWLAKERSIDSAAPRGGDMGWFTIEQLDKPLKESIDTLKIGDISPILKIDSQYRIIRLKEKSGGEVEEFGNIRSAVYMAAFNKGVDKIYNEYVAKLRKEANIEVYDDAVQSFQKTLER